MRTVAAAAGSLAALVLLALPLRAPAGDPEPAPWGVPLDGGCSVRLDARASTGVGCHVHFVEPAPDGGTFEGLAAVKCDGTFEICGETIRCHCPDW